MRVMERDITGRHTENLLQKTGNKLLFFIFVAGCLAGWIYEEIFYFVTEGILEKKRVSLWTLSAGLRLRCGRHVIVSKKAETISYCSFFAFRIAGRRAGIYNRRPYVGSMASQMVGLYWAVLEY